MAHTRLDVRPRNQSKHATTTTPNNRLKSKYSEESPLTLKTGESSKAGESSKTLTLPKLGESLEGSHSAVVADGDGADGDGVRVGDGAREGEGAHSAGDDTQEYIAVEGDVSRSFDDNCNFERAKECSEDEDEDEEEEDEEDEDIVENVQDLA